MLTYNLDNRGKTPLYLYLYQCIRDDILSGKIAPNEKLPSKRTLASHLRTSVITVQNAYQLLQIEGYVYSKEKVGYFAQELGNQPALQRDDALPSAIDNTEHVYFADFSSNKVQPSLFPVSSLRKLMREAISLDDPVLFNTIPYNGTEIMRNAIADYLGRSRNMDVDPQQIVIGCGIEYLYSRLMQLFPEYTVLGLEDPGNHKFADIAALYRIRAEYVPIDAEGVQLDALGHTDVDLLHLSPANSFPFGAVMPIRRRLDVLDWLYDAEGRYLIEDDFDSEITSYGSTTMPVFHNDTRGRTIYLNSFSKTMLPSLRVAYMVLPATLLARYRETMTFYSCTVSGADQYAYAKFISEGHFERHLNHLNTFFRTEKKTVLEEIERVGLGKVSTAVVPPAGTHLMLKLQGTGVAPRQMKENARKLDIRIAFLSDYSARPTPDMERYLVLNYASIQPGRLHEALRRLMKCVTQETVDPLA